MQKNSKIHCSYRLPPNLPPPKKTAGPCRNGCLFIIFRKGLTKLFRAVERTLPFALICRTVGNSCPPLLIFDYQPMNVIVFLARSGFAVSDNSVAQKQDLDIGVFRKSEGNAIAVLSLSEGGHAVFYKIVRNSHCRNISTTGRLRLKKPACINGSPVSG